MTRLRIGSGGSAFSLGFAAGFGAAGGLAAGTAPALAIGEAGVLPSTGSAIFPLSDLSIKIMNRDYSYTGFLLMALRYSLLYFRKPLPVKANSDFRAYLLPWFVFWTARYILGGVEPPPARVYSARLGSQKNF